LISQEAEPRLLQSGLVAAEDLLIEWSGLGKFAALMAN
jgi:hypothetical protein